MGRTIWQIAYHLIARGTTYQELGADDFDRCDQARVTKRLVHRLEALGDRVRLTVREVVAAAADRAVGATGTAAPAPAPAGVT